MDFVVYKRAALCIKDKAVNKKTASVQVNMSSELFNELSDSNAVPQDRYGEMVSIGANVAHWSDPFSDQRIEPLEHWLEVWRNEEVIAIARTGEDEYLYSFPMRLDEMRAEFNAKLPLAA